MPPRGSEGVVSGSAATLRGRVQHARSEGRFQTALELVKQLVKQEPTTEHRELHKEVMLARATELLDKGARREAAPVFQNARLLDPHNPEWLLLVGAGLARCGEVRAAADIVRQLGAALDTARLLGHIADAAVELEAAGRDLLPEGLQADFDSIRTSFGQLEQGKDEAARESLQSIGLRSPFLEWKVLLRGLQAYYLNDDARALENWQRLTPDRLPARLAAPFRYQLDADFRTAQPPATQLLLRGQFDRLQGSALAQQLRALQAAALKATSLAGIFRQVETLLPTLKIEAPTLLPRLAHWLYWATIDSGPDDILRYRRVFGEPADDPHFNRLTALAYDRHGSPEKAHAAWAAYEKDLAAMERRWPPGHIAHARALVWLHMGQEAAVLPGTTARREIPAFLRAMMPLPAALKPGVEECLRQAIKLHPDLMDAYEELFQFFARENKHGKAEKIALAALKRRPDHATLLADLSELYQETNRYRESLDYLLRAVAADPLNRELRRKLAIGHMLVAREHAEAGRWDEARGHYESALAEAPREEVPTVHFRWAAAEFKAGNAARAEELLQQAEAAGGSLLLICYGMLTECGRLRLPKELKDRFEDRFAELLAAPPAAESASQLAQYWGGMRSVTYTGQKTHDKKVLDYVKRAKSCSFSESQYLSLCEALTAAASRTLAQTFIRKAKREFPHHPRFPFLEAMTFCDRERGQIPHYKVEPLLRQAEQLAQALPREHPQRDQWLEEIRNHLVVSESVNPFMQSILDQFMDFTDER